MQKVLVYHFTRVQPAVSEKNEVPCNVRYMDPTVTFRYNLGLVLTLERAGCEGPEGPVLSVRPSLEPRSRPNPSRGPMSVIPRVDSS